MCMYIYIQGAQKSLHTSTFITRQPMQPLKCLAYERKEKIVKFYYLNIISFKCSLLLYKHKRTLRTVSYMTVSKVSAVITSIG